jgi:hypothetical protein
MRLAEGRIPTMEGTLRVQRNSRGSAVEVRADADGIISHAGVGLLVELADRLGLTGALGWRAGRGRRRRHPDAWVLRDLAVMLADGGDCLSDLGVLRAQPELFGEVASTPTAWRVVERLATDPDGLARLRAARAHARARAWQAGAHPDSQLLVVDLDATLVDAHSEKQGAAGTYKHTFGSIRCWPIWTAPMGPVSRRAATRQRRRQRHRRPGRGRRAGVGAAARPGRRSACGHAIRLGRRDAWAGRQDAGAGGGILDRPADRCSPPPGDPDGARTGLDGGGPTRPNPQGWRGDRGADRPDRPARLAAGDPCDLPPRGPHPGAQLSFTDLDGHRFQVFVTDQPEGDIAQLELRHRQRARVEDRIRGAKATGLANLPFERMRRNAVWLELVLLAQDLVCWAQTLLLDGELASAFREAWG